MGECAICRNISTFSIYGSAMQRVLCNAFVDVIREPEPNHPGVFRVEVWGRPPHDYTRFYQIDAKDDNMAAQEGIRLFVEEMEQLFVSKD